MYFRFVFGPFGFTRSTGVLLTLAGILGATASAQDRYKIVGLPTPAGYSSAALGLNDNGNVVGYSFQGDNYQAFLYSQGSGSSTDVGSLGGQMNAACAINASDQVAGYSGDSNGNLNAFIYTKDGGIKALGALDGGVSSEAFGLNNSGQAVGDSQNATDDHRPVLFDNAVKDLNVCVAQNSNTFRTAYAINDAGQVAGRTDTDQGAIHAFILASPGGDLKDIGTLGGSNSEALAINKAGEVVGDAETGNGTPHAFLYRKGSTRDLGALPGFGTASYGRSINDQGEVVGESDSADQKRAFVFSNGQMLELDKLATNLTGAGFTSLDGAYGINNRGWIVGYGTGTDGRTLAFLAIPEGQKAAPQVQPPAAQRPAAQPQAEGQAEEGNGDDFDVFYYRLSSDGEWVEAGDYGYVFCPRAAHGDDWAPYRDGHWVWTDRGWFWYSNEHFGWATYHYGRWVRVSGQGWCWVPGHEWAPAWVSWRHSSEYCGWAPLPPEANLSVNVGIGNWADSYYGLGPAAYSFISYRSWGQPSYVRVLVPPAQNVQIIRQTTNITNIRIQNMIINNFGPGVETVAQFTNQKIVPAKVVFNPARQAEYGVAIQGSELLVAAPAEKLRPIATAQPPVKVRLAKVEVDKGWQGVNSAEQSELRQKIVEQNPPPKEQLPKPVLVKPTFVHETKNLNPPPGPGPQRPQPTSPQLVPPSQASSVDKAMEDKTARQGKRPETGAGKGWNTLPPNLIGGRKPGGETFEKTLPDRRSVNAAVTPKNAEQRLRGKGQPSGTPEAPGQLERQETPAPAGALPGPKGGEQPREQAGGPKVEKPPKPEETIKPEASASPEASAKRELRQKGEGAPKVENFSKPEGSPKGESIRKEEGAPKAGNPPKEEHAPKNESIKKEEGAPKVQNPPKEEHSPKGEPAKKEQAPPKSENQPKEERSPKGEPVNKEPGAPKPENRGPAGQGQRPENPEKEKGKGKEKGSPTP